MIKGQTRRLASWLRIKMKIGLIFIHGTLEILQHLPWRCNWNVMIPLSSRKTSGTCLISRKKYTRNLFTCVSITTYSLIFSISSSAMRKCWRKIFFRGGAKIVKRGKAGVECRSFISLITITIQMKSWWEEISFINLSFHAIKIIFVGTCRILSPAFREFANKYNKNLVSKERQFSAT